MTNLPFIAPLDERLPLINELPPFGPTPVPEEIAAFDAFAAPVDGYAPPEVATEDLEIPGPHGSIPVRVYRPEGDARFGFVWIHGGGFVFGDIDMAESDTVARELAVRAGAVIVTVDYRLCQGGVHFPVPHDDVFTAYRWATTAGLVPAGASWAVGGGSAGGCLAAGLAQRLRDEGTPTAAQVLVYPVLHDPVPQGDPTFQERMTALPVVLRFPPEFTRFLNSNYLGENPSDVAYAFAGEGDVSGLPPTLTTVADHDELRPSGERYAAQIEESGGSVEVEFVADSPHGYLGTGGLSSATTSLERITAFLLEHC